MRSADADGGVDALANGARDGDDERVCLCASLVLIVRCALCKSDSRYGVNVRSERAASGRAVTGCLLFIIHVMCGCG